MKYMPLRKMTGEGVVEAVRLYDSGLSVGDVATFFGISRNAMYDLLKRRTVMRSNIRFGKDNHFFRGGPNASDQCQNILEKAIEKGVMVRLARCQSCGSSPTFKDGRSGVQAHHGDYNKPLDVTWLCQKCHHDWHKVNRPVKKIQVR